ncbi:MAG: Lrp/AsnC family transcriptional regulator [Caldimonas sp.]
MLSAFDEQLLRATQAGLPLVARPYESIAASLQVSSDAVRQRFEGMLREGLVRRIGAVAGQLERFMSGLSVWDVADDVVDDMGEKVGAFEFVSHCYRRPRALPDWPYNLFAMVHGRDRGDVERRALQIRCLLAETCRNQDILYRSRVLKTR